MGRTRESMLALNGHRPARVVDASGKQNERHVQCNPIIVSGVENGAILNAGHYQSTKTPS